MHRIRRIIGGTRAVILLTTIAKTSPTASVGCGIAFPVIVDKTDGVDFDECVVCKGAIIMGAVTRIESLVVVIF